MTVQRKIVHADGWTDGFCALGVQLEAYKAEKERRWTESLLHPKQPMTPSFQCPPSSPHTAGVWKLNKDSAAECTCILLQ